ncbi:hypothetical protein FBZ98_11633 [Rhizobium sp. ERR 922]|nr:hypothetical protein FBZ98_11633 [Rhizobium sp. ERR 922]TWB87934.1 hypothetical protein FBZ97_11520 [Rhizobium sp. ERR 942]
MSVTGKFQSDGSCKNRVVGSNLFKSKRMMLSITHSMSRSDVGPPTGATDEVPLLGFEILIHRTCRAPSGAAATS